MRPGYHYMWCQLPAPLPGPASNSVPDEQVAGGVSRQVCRASLEVQEDPLTSVDWHIDAIEEAEGERGDGG